MTVPCMSFAQLKDVYLIPNGWSVEDPQAQDFWNEQDRIIIKKGDYAFPLQFRKKYFYVQVVILLNQLGIPVPEDHQTCYDQQRALERKMHEERTLNVENSKKEKGG